MLRRDVGFVWPRRLAFLEKGSKIIKFWVGEGWGGVESQVEKA